MVMCVCVCASNKKSQRAMRNLRVKRRRVVFVRISIRFCLNELTKTYNIITKNIQSSNNATKIRTHFSRNVAKEKKAKRGVANLGEWHRKNIYIFVDCFELWVNGSVLRVNVTTGCVWLKRWDLFSFTRFSNRFQSFTFSFFPSCFCSHF